jgi:dihydropteroate synthase
MGVLNITPDSFASDRHLVANGTVDVTVAVEEAARMAAGGADIIDVGGESTRPGADPVSADEESARVLPVIEALVGRLPIPISIDTYKASVAGRALSAGAAIVNDISGLLYEPDLAHVARDAGAPLVLMHTRGRSHAMYDHATYGDVVADVSAELRASMDRALAGGVPLEQLIVDPGIGFAKQAAHSYGVLAQLSSLASTLGRPLLVGPSRKSFLRDAVNDRPASERDWGTAAAVTAAVLAGAHIVRVHAVAEMAQVVRVAEEIRKADELADGHA